METINQIFTTKQYKNEEIQLVLQSPKDADHIFLSEHSRGGGTQNFALNLTLIDNKEECNFKKQNMFNGVDAAEFIVQSGNLNNVCENQYISPPRKKRKRKNIVIDYPSTSSQNFHGNVSTFEISRDVLGEIYNKASSSETLQNHADARVEEVMKAAKSLFSKRTRTLYHWMHPNAPKQQIKAAVSSSWDSLGTQEKQFYISQVLGRFGFPQCNLMVNPQLGGIKELPPLADITTFNDISTDELQSAISSIANENSNVIIPESSIYNHFPITRKKRLGRPPGSKNKKNLIEHPIRTTINQDFQDDPELSEELQQFAMNLNLP